MTAQQPSKAKLFIDGCVASTNDVATWCLWFARVVIAIGCAYVAARYFSLGWFSLEGIRIPYPRVTAEPLQLAYLAGCLWLVK